MLYNIKIDIGWNYKDGSPGSHRETRGVRAVSSRHALNKALKHAMGLPCYADRAGAAIPVSAEVSLHTP